MKKSGFHRGVTSGLLVLALGACSSASPEQVAQSTPSAISTSDVISRAEQWVDARLHYCQSARGAYDGDSSCWAWEGPSHVCDRQSDSAWNAYRSDCSGFVTWSWGLPAVGDGGYVTGDFAPFDGSISYAIDGRSLQPGDALNKNTNEHIVLFKQWITPGSSAEFLEEPGCSVSTPYAHEFTSNVSISGSNVYIDYEGGTFVAIRFNGVTTAPPAPPPMPADAQAHSIGADQDGRLEAFALWTDGSVRHDWQDSAGGSFQSWAEMPGFSATSYPVVVQNRDGRNEVFARGKDNALWHDWQTAPDVGWHGWSSLGGTVGGTRTAAVRNMDGTLEAFVRGSDDAVHHIWQTTSGGSWSAWSSLGGDVSSNVAVGVNHDGRLEVFAVGAGSAIWHNWWKDTHGGWNGWARLGGTAASDPVVGRDADGRLEVFFRGTDNAVHHAWQTTPGGTWSDVASLGGYYSGDIAVAANSDGRLEVFAIGGNSKAIWHAWQTTPNGSWSSFGEMNDVTMSDRLDVGVDKGGRLEVFARGTDGALWHSWQNTPDGSWSNFASLGGSVEE